MNSGICQGVRRKQLKLLRIRPDTDRGTLARFKAYMHDAFRHGAMECRQQHGTPPPDDMLPNGLTAAKTA